MYIENAVVAAIALFASLFSCEAAYVDTLTKCSISDKECFKKLYRKALDDVGGTGLPELGLPSIDPLTINNISIQFLDTATLSISEAIVDGVKTCVISDFSNDFANEKGHLEGTCDRLTIKGVFTMAGEGSGFVDIVQDNALNGQGKATVEIEKLKFSADFLIQPIEKNGEIYLSNLGQDIKYTQDIGKIKFTVEKLILGDKDISELVNPYLNENWKTLYDKFGSTFVHKAVEIFSSLLEKFLGSIPANKYIIEDLSSYVKH